VKVKNLQHGDDGEQCDNTPDDDAFLFHNRVMWPNGQKLSHRRTDVWQTQRFPTNRIAGRRLAPALC
jgi:hypothetical protein